MTDSKYNKRELGGKKIDIYRIITLFGITHPAHQHAVKKLIRAGQSIKPLEQDIDEVIESLERWKEMLAEDGLALVDSMDQEAMVKAYYLFTGKDLPDEHNKILLKGDHWVRDADGIWRRDG